MNGFLFFTFIEENYHQLIQIDESDCIIVLMLIEKIHVIFFFLYLLMNIIGGKNKTLENFFIHYKN